MKNQTQPSQETLLKSKKTKNISRKTESTQCVDDSQIRFTPKKKILKF